MRPYFPEPDDINGRLSVLSRREAEVILLRMQAMKYREIGSQLGISSKTVGTLLTRAIQKLPRYPRRISVWFSASRTNDLFQIGVNRENPIANPE